MNTFDHVLVRIGTAGSCSIRTTALPLTRYLGTKRYFNFFQYNRALLQSYAKFADGTDR